jgi:hypothetical protein
MTDVVKPPTRRGSARASTRTGAAHSGHAPCDEAVEVGRVEQLHPGGLDLREPVGLHWSLPDAAQQLGILPITLQRCIDAGEPVAVQGAHGRGMVIAAEELRRYEAERRSLAIACVSEATARVIFGTDREPGPQLPLVKQRQNGERHALAPGAEGGPTLCGLAPAEEGWYFAGYKGPWCANCRVCWDQGVVLLGLGAGGGNPR